eukprot:scaffold7698_cov186-Alexandrium_tamarense.AAC.3
MENNNVWINAAKWITDNGGHVHPLLRYDELQRRVFIGTSAHVKSDGSTSSSRPSDDVTRELDEVYSLSSSSDNDVDGGTPPTKASKGDDGNDGKLYHDAQDVILGLFLAHLQEQLQQLQPPTDDDTSQSPIDSQAPWTFFRPYLNTLPSTSSNSSSDDALLPRQWSQSTLQRRLEGTSLYNRILKEQSGLRREYDVVKFIWARKQSETTTTDVNVDSYPSFESYDNMMAMISSRGFAGLGYDGVDALVPLLDLLNHTRGRSVGSKETDTEKIMGGLKMSNTDIKDVRYARYEQTTPQDAATDATIDNSQRPPLPKRTKHEANSRTKHCIGGVIVTANKRLTLGSELQMTYGAKGNAALLGRYGFCIENNIEPDGSCNDILEIQLKPEDTQIVQLQRGPKAYSYGPFVKAMGLFDETADGSHEMEFTDEGDANVEHDTDAGLDDFMNSCDNEEEEEEEEEEEDMYGGDEVDDDSNGDFYSSMAEPSRDKSAYHRASIKENIKVLEHLKKKSSSDSCAGEYINMMSAEQDGYCLILIRSELQTIEFYLAIAITLKRRLGIMLEMDTESPEDKAVVTQSTSLKQQQETNEGGSIDSHHLAAQKHFHCKAQRTEKDIPRKWQLFSPPGQRCHNGWITMGNADELKGSLVGGKDDCKDNCRDENKVAGEDV